MRLVAAAEPTEQTQSSFKPLPEQAFTVHSKIARILESEDSVTHLTMGGVKIGLASCLLLGMVFIATADEAPEPLGVVAKSVNDFTTDMYLATAESKTPGDNILVSPLSAAIATAMVHAGAKGVTAQEITKAMHLPGEKAVLEKGFTDLHDKLTNVNNVTLKVANRVSIEKTMKPKDDFLNVLIKVFRSEMYLADFLKDYNNERIKINQWVAENTQDKIKDLLKEGSIDASARIVLVNALYFHGLWKMPFKKEQTQDQDFSVSKDKKVKVPMMQMLKKMGYADIPELAAKAIELCYENQEVCMQFILPDAVDGLAEMESKLRTGAFKLDDIKFDLAKVQLSVPRFRMEGDVNLKTLYEKMGMASMFNDAADLSGIVEDTKIVVSTAVQKTFIEINEAGTEAAAASGFVGVNRAALVDPRAPREMRFDHPFMARLIIGTGSEPRDVTFMILRYCTPSNA